MRDEGESQMQPESAEKAAGLLKRQTVVASRCVNAAACGLGMLVVAVLGWKLLCGG